MACESVAEEHETDRERQLAAFQAREVGCAERMRAAREVMAAADLRDARADARDRDADKRDHDIDLAQFLAADGEYGKDWPERRAAALDRQQARDDRVAARRDRIALARNWVEPGAGQPGTRG
jgi:uncharacterized protein (DUF3084 family)